MGAIGIAAGAALSLFGTTKLADSVSADDSHTSKRLQTGALINAAAWFALNRFGMKDAANGFLAGAVIMGGMAYNAHKFETDNPQTGAGLVDGAAAVLGLPSPAALQAPSGQLPAGGATNTSTTTTTSTTAPLVINRY